MIKQFYLKKKINLTSASTTLGPSVPGSDSNEEVLHISQSSSITGTSASDCLVSYPGHLLERSYPSAEKQLVNSTASTEWACKIV